MTQQVGYLVAFMVEDLGILIGLLANAMSDFGNFTAIGAGDVPRMNDLTTGIFGTTDGLIYWMKNDLFYLVNYLGEPTAAGKLANFIAALILGSGATTTNPWPWS
jgi:riboflavin transporter FmnP